MMQSRIPGYALLTLLVVATPAFARVVISEVMWMGSDQSTADEWVELSCVDGGCPQTLSGWMLTSLGTNGTEQTTVRFGDVSIDANQYFVVSNYPASQSRLATDPILTTTAMVLPNTKLLLRLRDASGAIIDEVDDGVGVPFAGVNPSGTGAKASMERIDLLISGTVKENWQTATLTSGFDDGVPIFGTPGFPRISSSSSSSVSSVSSVASVSSSCAPDVSNIHIAIQSGEPRGEEKVTVNLQLLWEGKGTLHCTWDYRDGFTSTSCNPTSHTFTIVGTYEVHVEAEDACGRKTVQTLPIEVLETEKIGGIGEGAAWRASGSSMSAESCMPRTFGGIEITRFLPNPNGGDVVGEWVELRNVSDRVAVLCGWLLDDVEGGSTPFPLDTITLAPKEIRRLSASLTGLGLNNDQDHIRLFVPARVGNPVLAQDVSYTNAREGIIMNALLPTQGIQGRVVRVIDGDTVVLAIDNREVTVRLLGIDAPEPGSKGEEGQWGQKATEFLRGLLEGGIVSLAFDEERQDVYGRILAYLSVGGHDVQAELLKRGLAAVYRRCTCTRKTGYLRLETEAREQKMGMWGMGHEEETDETEEPREVRTGKQSREGPGDKEEKLGIVLSETYPVPLPAEGEWVELWNGSQQAIDLSGWKLDDAEGGGSRGWEFPGGFIVQPGAFIVLRSDQTHLALNNEGDSVALITPEGSVVDHLAYGKLRRGHAFARVIQRIGNTGAFRTTDRFCVTSHPTPFERNICEEELLAHHNTERVILSPSKDDTNGIATSPKVRRVVRLARRVRYRNVPPPGVSSGSVATSDPMLATLLAHMERSVQNGQVLFGEEDMPSGKEKTVEWEAMLLPFLLVVGAHGMLTGVRRSS